MGFKRINLKDLETSIIPAFLGLPLKHIEETELIKIAEKEQKLSKIENRSHVLLLNEEILEYNFDKNGEIENFIGSGSITVINNSEKDRIWDTKLILSGTQNTNIQSEEAIILGNFEPKSNKLINYSIVDYEELPDPVKVTEIIEVLDINTEKIASISDKINLEGEEKEIILQKVPEKIKIKDLDLPKNEESTLIKKQKMSGLKKEHLNLEKSIIKEFNNKYDTEVEDINFKLENEREALEEINLELKEYVNKRKNQKKIINSLKKNYDSLLKAKLNAISKNLKKSPEEMKIEKISEPESLISETKNQINENEEDLAQIEEKYLQRIDNIKNDVDNDYNLKINDIQSELRLKQEELNETTKNISDWNDKRKDLKELIKNLKKKSKTLSIIKPKVHSPKLKKIDEKETLTREITIQIKKKEEEIKKIEEELSKKEVTLKNKDEFDFTSQIKSLDSQIIDEQNKLDEILKNIDNLNEDKKKSIFSIKTIKNDYKSLQKNKSNELSTRLKRTSKNKDFVKKIEIEVDNEYNAQIEEIESKLNAEQKNLEEIIKNFNEWDVKKNESSNLLKNLKKEHKNLLKNKSKELDTKLKSIPDKEKVEKEINEDILKKESNIKKEIDNEFDSQIKNIDSKITIEQKNLEVAIKNINEWNEKKNILNDSAKNSKNHLDKLLKTKSKALNKKLVEMRLNGIFIDDESEKKLEKELNDEFETKIKSAESELSVEQKKLDDAIKNINEWNEKKDISSNIVKDLEKECKNLIKTKSKALKIRLKRIIGKDDFTKKVEKDVNAEFDPKIKTIELKINTEDKNLEEFIKNFNEWEVKKNESSNLFKNLKKEYKTLLKIKSKEIDTRIKSNPDKDKTEKEINKDILKKESYIRKEIDNEFDPEIKRFELKLKAEQEKLDEIIGEIDELNEKKNSLNNYIQILKKEHKKLLKSKPLTLSKGLDKLIKDKKNKIENLKDQISKKQDKIIKLKADKLKKRDLIDHEIKNKYGSQIKNGSAELNIEKENLNVVIKKIDEWDIKKREINEIIKDLIKKEKKLLKTKSKGLNKKLEELAKEKEIKFDELRSQLGAKKGKLEKIKNDSSKLETSIEKEIEIEYEPKINSAKQKLELEQKNLDKIIKKIDTLTNNKKEFITNIKDLDKNRKSLLKAKSKALSKRLKDIPGKEIIEKKTDLVKKDDETIRIEDGYLKKEAKIKDEIEEEFNPQIESIESQLNIEQENLEDAIKNVNEWNTKKNQLTKSVKNLKKNYKNLNKVRPKGFKVKTDNIVEKKPSIEESKNLTNIEEEIEKIEEEYLEKEDIIKQEIENEFANQTEGLNSKLSVEQKNLDDLIENLNELEEKKKKIYDSIKEIKKEKKNLLKSKSKEIKSGFKKITKDKERAEKVIEKDTLNKDIIIKKKIDNEFESQIKSIELELNTEQKNLDEVIKKINEVKEKKKEFNNSKKKIEKNLQNLFKTRSKSHKTKLKNLIKEKESKLEEIRSQISEKEGNITKFKKKSTKEVDFIEAKVKQKDLIQKSNIASELKVNRERLTEAIKNFNEWNERKKKLIEIVKDLKNKEKEIQKVKTKTMSIRLEKIAEEKKIKINEIKTTEAEIKETEMLHEDGISSESSELDVISSKSKDKEIENAEKEIIDLESDTMSIQNNLILLYNQKNTLKFTIKLENTTKFILEDIRIGKRFSEEFFNFKYESKTISNVELIKNSLICNLKELNPNEKVEIVIYADVNPIEKKLIGTGRIQLSYNYKDYLISGLNLENFTAYSHAMHAIKIKEKETEPNIWVCSLIFKNNSDLDIELNSILVLDKNKEKKYIDLDFSSERESYLIKSGEKFISKEWNVRDENEPKFFRKLGYSITHKNEKSSKINMKFEEDIFEIVDIDLSKRFSKTEIKSFEKDVLDCLINIKNIGTIPIQGLKIIDFIPEDFLPPIEFSDYHIRTSKGISFFDDIKFKLTPNNQDHTIPHIIEIIINLELNSSNILDVNEFLEVKYPIKAISPSYRKKYDFKLNINSYFLKEKINLKNYYSIENILSKNRQPEINIIHKRRDLVISKEIFPGKTVDEFVINVLIKNNSNVELCNIEIKDTISKSFELVNSNIECRISEAEVENNITLSFIVDRILPYQESEIRYYVNNKSGKKIDYDELESFIFG